MKEGKRICLVVSNAEEIDIMPCEENVEMIKINLGIDNQVVCTILFIDKPRELIVFKIFLFLFILLIKFTINSKHNFIW